MPSIACSRRAMSVWRRLAILGAAGALVVATAETSNATGSDLTFTAGSWSIDTSTGAVSVNGGVVVVPSSLDVQPDGSTHRVFEVGSLTAEAGSIVRISGTYPAEFHASGPVTLGGTIDASGFPGAGPGAGGPPGPGADSGGSGGAPGRGGENGGGGLSGGRGAGPDRCGGIPGVGGVGGPGEPGANGTPCPSINTSAIGNGGGGGGASHGVVPPFGPGAGGGGGGSAGPAVAPLGGGGGGGGGKVVFLSAQSITVSGSLLATGGRGGNGMEISGNSGGGGGGGGGGAWAFDASSVTFAAAARVDARGGPGGDAGDTRSGRGGRGGHGTVFVHSTTFSNNGIVFPAPIEHDTTPPSISITAPADGSNVSGTTSVSAEASDNVRIEGVQFRLDDAALGAEDTSAPYSVDWDTTAATNSTHTLTAVAHDAAGNSTTSAVVSVTVSNDVSAPVVSIDSTPPNPTNDNTPTFAFSADEPATFQCSLSKGADSFESCESPKTYSAQVDGLYTFKVKGTDDAGNTSEAIAYSFEIDATPPAAPSAPDLDAASDTGLSDSDNETSDVTPTFSGTAEAGSTVKILVDGIERGSGVASSTYSITTDALLLGDHVVVARAEDPAGNLSAQSGPLTVRIVDATCHAPNRIVGTERPNLLVGTAGADVMLGLGGTDALFGLGGADCLSGGAGDDILAGGSGDDESVGGDGRDYIDPGPGSDLVSGGSGDDSVDARDGAVDHIDCGSGTRDAATVDRIDQLTGCERVSRGR